MRSKSARSSKPNDEATGGVAPFSSPPLHAPQPVHQDIAARAYEKFIDRGYVPGFDVQDWVAAERELTDESGARPAASDRMPSLRSLKDLEHYTVSGTDGDIGDVVNFLIDDESWTIRYMVVDAGTFFDRRRVLISPNAFREVDRSNRTFHLSLTMEKVKNAPSVESDLPVSRQNERAYHDYYGYPYYWGQGGAWDMTTASPTILGRGEGASLASGHLEDFSGDVHLRSAKELHGYHIQGTDDGIGHVKDFVVDDGSWAIRYLIIDTSNWWFGKKVLLAPHWARRISWADRLVFVELTRDAIKNSPTWKGIDSVNRAYETDLYTHYGRTPYWLTEDPGYRSRLDADTNKAGH
ncbi:MAG TPA: PRC-barrel domain-containing protein [Polyangia bacterium]|jgi:hypothetical protein